MTKFCSKYFLIFSIIFLVLISCIRNTINPETKKPDLIPFEEQYVEYQIEKLENDSISNLDYDLKTEENIIKSIQAEQLYPNPFSPTTDLNFEVFEKGDFEICLFDTTGKKISQIFTGYLDKGKYKAKQKKIHINTGIYVYIFKRDDKIVESMKIIHLK